MARAGTRDLAVGTVFALALTILALAVMAVGGDLPGLSKKMKFKVIFPNADGLLLGAPVRMAGVDIGDVAGIRLPVNPEKEGIEVLVSVDRTYAARVRGDSRAALRILQLLTDEKFVEIFPGSPEQPQLPEGAVLPIEPGREILEQGEAIAENLLEITGSLKRVLEQLDEGEGLLGRLINDPHLGREGLESLGETLKNTEALTEDLRAGRGVAGRLLSDEQLAAKLDSLFSAVDDFSELMAAVRRREGLLGELLVDDGPAEQALADLRETAASLRRLSERLESENSVLGGLMAEDACAASLSTNICETMDSLSALADKLNSSEGTLGALIHDRSLYDSAEDLVAGTNDSKFTRWLLRRYRKRGIKVEEAVPVPEPPPARAPIEATGD